MTRSLIARRSCAALVVGLTALLSACGGGSASGGGGDANLRVLNATTDVPSVDVYLGNAKSFSATPADTLSSYAVVGANSYDIKVTSAGNTNSLLTGNFALAKDHHYTGVVWGSNGALKLVTLPEDEDTALIAANSSRIRVYNATTAESGSFDVHLTQNVDVLSAGTVTAGSIAPASLGAYKEMPAGTYRLRITAAGNTAPGYVRLDIPAITLGSQQYATLLITTGPSGVLVNSALLLQQGALTQYKNTQARVRLVSGTESAGNVSALIDGSTIVAGLQSPKVGPYAFVPAGDHLLDVRVNGSSISSTTRTFAAGGDYTLLAYGAPGAAQVRMVADDNRLPVAGRYKIRLVNAAANADLLTLSIDLAAILPDVAVGSASSFVTGVVTSTKSSVTVSSALGTNPYPATDQQLLSQGVYTMFIMGGGSTPAGALIKEN